LGKDADRRWLKVLFKEMDDPGPSSAQAIAAIGSIGDRSALKPLIKALGGQITTPIKSAIIQALGRLKDPSAIGPIFASIQDTKQHDVAGAVHYAILEIDSADALEPARALVAGLKGTAWQYWYYRQMLERLERKFGR
jgi:HEAT repeat protein